ncbi:MAG: FKBP-type peptidyl-prolyl cis-trans isomerase [Planctomycetota bacterium]
MPRILRYSLTALSLAAMLMTSSIASGQDAEKKAKLAKDNPIAYFIGISIGQQLKSQGLKKSDINLEALITGLGDAISDSKLELTDEELPAVAQKLQALINDRFDERMAAIRASGEKWLSDNLKKEGVKKLVGEMQYKVLKSGDGPSPNASDNVKVHYTGKLTNGRVFDSSVQRGAPAEFVVSQVIKGWQAALQKMQVGDKWMLYIPPEMAYGEGGSPPLIGPNEVLVFEVELLDIL